MGAAVGSLPLPIWTCNTSSVSSFKKKKKVEVYPASPPSAFCEADRVAMNDLNPSSTELAKLASGFGRAVVAWVQYCFML